MFTELNNYQLILRIINYKCSLQCSDLLDMLYILNVCTYYRLISLYLDKLLYLKLLVYYMHSI